MLLAEYSFAFLCKEKKRDCLNHVKTLKSPQLKLLNYSILRVPNRSIGIREFPYLKLRIQDFKAKLGKTRN